MDMKPSMDEFLKQGIYEKDIYENIKTKLSELMFGTKVKQEQKRDFVSREPYFVQRNR